LLSPHLEVSLVFLLPLKRTEVSLPVEVGLVEDKASRGEAQNAISAQRPRLI
jgi:hypothetical protein